MFLLADPSIPQPSPVLQRGQGARQGRGAAAAAAAAEVLLRVPQLGLLVQQAPVPRPGDRHLQERRRLKKYL